MGMKANGLDLAGSSGVSKEGEDSAVSEEDGLAQQIIWSMVKDRFLIEARYCCFY